MDSDIIEEDIDGSIHSIHVRNFFCHENLEINLNRNVNFIVGRNGSGKSAILTALVVGLGGRASATNRGTNLHSFIKKGASSATVEIKIKNNSAKAYKHNVYGDFITIVRHINASGGSSYKVKSSKGEVISTRYDEVNSIIMAHDIQVDNPISVLNQDDARSFHASDAKKKYSLFRKATNLDQMEANYVWALDKCHKGKTIQSKKTEACQELEREYKKWKTSYDQLQSRDEIESQKQALQNEYYWSEIVELEREVKQIQTQYDKQKVKVDKLVDKLRQMTDSCGNNSSALDTLKESLKESTVEKSSVQQELSSLEGEAREAGAAWRGAQHAAAKHRDLLARETRKLQDLDNEIKNIDSGRSESGRASASARLEEARAAAGGARARYDTAQHDAAQARAHLAHAHAQHEQAAARAATHADKLKQLRQQLRELESRGHDSLAVYGGSMVELCQRVRRAASRGEFSAPPRGPVGSYLKVKDKKWGGALEHIIGGSINSFCVNSPEDSRKLFEIMGQVYGRGAKPGVTCSKFLGTRHEVRGHAVHARGFHSALDALDVPDPVVANFLIDNVGLERVLLVPNHEDAVRLSDTVENVPENCSKVVTLDCTEYHPAPRYRSYGGSARAARFLALSTAERKKQLVSEIEEAESSLQSLEEQAAQLQAEAEGARAAERAAARTLQALLAERHKRDEAERAAAAALDAHHAPHHAVLIDELDVCKEKVQKLTEQLQTLSSKDEQYKKKVDELEERIQKGKIRLGLITSSCRSISEEIEKEQHKIDQGLTERQTYQHKLKEDKNKMSQVKTIVEEKNRVIDEKVKEAMHLCPRIENPREKLLVTNELKKTQLKLSSIRSDGLSKAQVAERLLDVERKYRRTRLTLDRSTALLEEVNKAADKHMNFAQRMQTYIARKVQHCFQSILTLRGYQGRMDIDNGRGTLELMCSGRDSSTKRVAASTSSLSGGERSYSTVAFIMALWDCVELPFYFMDEFDVFMDNVNRKIVMELLVDHALKNTSRQFVFLTPQDASAVCARPRLTIHVMADPRP